MPANSNTPEPSAPADKPKPKIEAPAKGERPSPPDTTVSISFRKGYYNSANEKSWVAEISGLDSKYGLSRSFLDDPDEKDWSDYNARKKKGSYTFHFNVSDHGAIFEVNDRNEKEMRIYFPYKQDGQWKMGKRVVDADDLKKAGKKLEKNGYRFSDLIDAMSHGKAAGLEDFDERIKHFLDMKNKELSKKNKDSVPYYHASVPQRYSRADCQAIIDRIRSLPPATHRR